MKMVVEMGNRKQGLPVKALEPLLLVAKVVFKASLGFIFFLALF